MKYEEVVEVEYTSGECCGDGFVNTDYIFHTQCYYNMDHYGNKANYFGVNKCLVKMNAVEMS